MSITLTENENNYMIRGDLTNFKDIIKATGGTWFGLGKCWLFAKSTFNREQIDSLVKRISSQQETSNPAPNVGSKPIANVESNAAPNVGSKPAENVGSKPIANVDSNAASNATQSAQTGAKFINDWHQVLDFGKYEGKKLEEVPEDYVDWLARNMKDKPIVDAIKRIRNRKGVTKLVKDIENSSVYTEVDRDDGKAKAHRKTSECKPFSFWFVRRILSQAHIGSK